MYRYNFKHKGKIYLIFNLPLYIIQVLSYSKRTLLQCASPDAIARLPFTKLKRYAEELWTEYFTNQRHGSLKDYLVHYLRKDTTEYDGSLVQVGKNLISTVFVPFSGKITNQNVLNGFFVASKCSFNISRQDCSMQCMLA